MRSACAIGLGLVLLWATNSARAQEELSQAKPNPSVTVIVIQTQPGAVVGPVRPNVPAGALTGWTLVPTRAVATAGGPTGHVNAPPPVNPIAGVFQAMDTNKDGKINKAEFKWSGDLFGAFDANHDGNITRPEATGYLAFVGLLSLQEKAREFRTNDANHDGKISQAEFKGSKERFARLDANHDGAITKEEAIHAFQGHVRRAMRIARLRMMDANHDGVISASEFKGPVTLFVRLDVNHDGQISRAEMIAPARQAANAQRVAQTANPTVAAPKAPVVTTTKTVTPVPVQAAAKATTPAVLGRWANRILALDADKDGKVCKAEYIKGIEARFNYLDQGKKGYITVADVSEVIASHQAHVQAAAKPVPAQASPAVTPVTGKPTATVKPATAKPTTAQVAPRGRGHGLTYILSMDANKDGKICKAEYLKGAEARFSYLDQDKNGYITATDLAQVAQARKTHAAPGAKPVATGKPIRTATAPPIASGVKTAVLRKKP
jgi:Ca2+-binding EF-hand superfamily protein